MSSRNSSYQTKARWTGASALGLTTLIALGLAAPATHAQGTSTPPPGLVTITRSTDGIVSSDSNGAPNVTGSNDTSNGAASNAIDNNIATSYINTTGSGSGLMITPGVGSTVVTEFSLTSGDTTARNPTSFALFGSTDPNAATDGNFTNFYSHSLGNGGISFTSTGQTLYFPVSLDGGTTLNSTSYSSYFLLLSGPASGNYLQIAEVGLMAAAPEPSQYAALGLGVLGLCGLALKARKRQAI
jgi:hypothetical protein